MCMSTASNTATSNTTTTSATTINKVKICVLYEEKKKTRRRWWRKWKKNLDFLLNFFFQFSSFSSFLLYSSLNSCYSIILMERISWLCNEYLHFMPPHTLNICVLCFVHVLISFATWRITSSCKANLSYFIRNVCERFAWNFVSFS